MTESTSPLPRQHPQTTRRRFMAYFGAAGLSSTLFPGVLWARWQEGKLQKISLEMIRESEQLAGLEFSDQERKLMLEDVNDNLESFETLRTIPIPNSVPPALDFNPVLPGMRFDERRRPSKPSRGEAPDLPENRQELAFWPVSQLSRLLRSRKITSEELTTLYLERLKRFDPELKCVVSLTEELALEQARRADRDIRLGRLRSPLHGVPWGAKDLLSVRKYPTSWGAAPYKDQVIDEDAAVVRRLEEAGAVLVAKLTLGALAWGDVWYGGTTKNPWNLEQGSSGSSAGPGSATAAGLVGFSIGTETWGSIVSPATRCGVTGLRPTFGRVSRHGAMALSWSMDKIGPMCRSVEDCALVLDAIYGPDGKDRTVADYPFNWDASLDARQLRVGYLEPPEDDQRSDEQKANDQAVLEALRSQGIDLKPVRLPDFPAGALSFILNAEAAAAFDQLTRSGRDDMMVRQIRMAWPNVFRHSRLIPAVEYIQANRARTLLMEKMAEMMQDLDAYVAPSFSPSLLITNLTGHPAVVLPNGFDKEGSPTSITFTGQLYGEAKLLSLAKAYQEATDFHRRQPPVGAV